MIDYLWAGFIFSTSTRTRGGRRFCNDACDSGSFSARGRHANDNERLYDYLVAAGRRGDGKKIAAAKAASADAKRLQRNKRSREK